jgi:predicted AAA+ superfamily ATPase
MDEQLLRVVTADNPWLEGRGLESWYQRRLPPSYLPRRLSLEPADERAVLVIGPRQSGKSTLIWHTLAATGQPCLYLNCEDPSIAAWLVSPGAFLADLAELAPESVALFFEEIQSLENAGLFLKGLVDRRIGRPIYATGSSAFHLEAATRESLAGRAHRHLLLPYSLTEISDSLPGKPALRRHRLEELLPAALVFGSYPRVHSSSDKSLELAELVEAFVVRDASDRFKIRRPDAFRRVLELAASQAGNLCNFSEWAALAQVSNDTVIDYCRLLEETHVLRLVRPFIGGKRAELTSTPKVFFLDNGIRNQLFGGFARFGDRGDRGALFENFVFTEMAKNSNPLLDGLHFWRSKSGAEVDFVLRTKDRLLAIEAKAGDARGQISRSARSFVEAYGPQKLLVVHQGERGETSLGETRVLFLRLPDLGPEIAGDIGFEP